MTLFQLDPQHRYLVEYTAGHGPQAAKKRLIHGLSRWKLDTGIPPGDIQRALARSGGYLSIRNGTFHLLGDIHDPDRDNELRGLYSWEWTEGHPTFTISDSEQAFRICLRYNIQLPQRLPSQAVTQLATEAAQRVQHHAEQQQFAFPLVQRRLYEQLLLEYWTHSDKDTLSAQLSLTEQLFGTDYSALLSGETSQSQTVTQWLTDTIMLCQRGR